MPRQVKRRGRGAGCGQVQLEVHGRSFQGRRVKQTGCWQTGCWQTKGDLPCPGTGASASRWTSSHWPAALCQLPEQQCRNTGLQLRIV